MNKNIITVFFENNYYKSFNEILKYQKEDELFKKIKLNKNKDSNIFENKISKKAKEELIKRNLSFVVKKAIKYLEKNVYLEDLISKGNIGLIKAINK